MLQRALFHFLPAESYFTVLTHTYHIFFIHSSAKGHLGSFYVLASVNSAAMNIGVHVSFQIMFFFSSGYMPGTGVAGSQVGNI